MINKTMGMQEEWISSKRSTDGLFAGLSGRLRKGTSKFLSTYTVAEYMGNLERKNDLLPAAIDRINVFNKQIKLAKNLSMSEIIVIPIDVEDRAGAEAHEKLHFYLHHNPAMREKLFNQFAVEYLNNPTAKRFIGKIFQFPSFDPQIEEYLVMKYDVTSSAQRASKFQQYNIQPFKPADIASINEGMNSFFATLKTNNFKKITTAVADNEIKNG